MEEYKDRTAILKKLGIEALNPMQLQAIATISTHDETLLLSPTGTGKTLAFLLPVLEDLKRDVHQIRVLILVPSRELAIQIEQVVRSMGTGFKANAVYGGRSGSKDKIELKHPPSILIGTPGRVADHIRRKVVQTEAITTLVLDEFDKSLEVGFEKEMKEIINSLPSVKKKILTSATKKVQIPDFVNFHQPQILNYLEESSDLLQLQVVNSRTKDKLSALGKLIEHIGNGRGILFCNFKETISFVSDFLRKRHISHACFYGGLEQTDRERALIKFRNGTHRLLVATDLAARGIDVPDLDFIIHYQLPRKKDEFIHRNGRTARMHSHGIAYIMKWEGEELPDFIKETTVANLQSLGEPIENKWKTLFISGGRKDKISKGDIAGLFFKQGNLQKGELGVIELKSDCAFVAVTHSKAVALSHILNNVRLKKKKVRIQVID